MNTVVVETVKQLRSMAKHVGLKKYSRMKKDQLLELIETKTEYTFERIPEPATKKEIMIKAKQHGLKGVGYDIPLDASSTQPVNVELLLRKGVYPYDYMDSFEKLQTTSLPSKKKLYNALANEDVSKADYEHAHKVWKEMGMTNMREYHDLYLKKDVHP
ncbi:unnamed protein product [Mytilus coruscus]|uniref:Rho termination factor-like N-terminal domain-containing protein n=1 Tax=Mytilus coruscus TaxID=42192 RepID=A0A6J8DU72_MYTCO|nr:unnamed protein product [Mytilus coruscus]